MPAVRGLFGLRLAVASLEREAQRDVPFEARLHLVEERQDGHRWLREVLEIARGQRRQLRGSAPEFLAKGRIEVGFRKCPHAAAGIEEGLPDLIDRPSFAPCLLQLRCRRALQIEEAGTFLRIAGSGDRLLLRRAMCRQPRAERTEQRDKYEDDGTHHLISRRLRVSTSQSHFLTCSV